MASQAQPPEYFHGRRYNAYNDWVKHRYGGRLQKVSIDAGFSCPNRDGTRGSGGCTFCNNRSFSPRYMHAVTKLNDQIELGLQHAAKRYGPERFVAYFQAYSNTYGSLDKLKAVYEEAMRHPKISGLVIATRPDCLPDAVLDYLKELSGRIVLELEVGIESCDDDVLQRCNRGHSFAETEDALHRARERDLFVTGHLLLGMPGETRETIHTGARKLAELPLDALKFHQLQVVKGSQLANEWRRAPDSFRFLGVEEYLEWVADFIELLPEHVKIQRLASEVPPAFRLTPGWRATTSELQRLLDITLRARGSWQGKRRSALRSAALPSVVEALHA